MGLLSLRLVLLEVLLCYGRSHRPQLHVGQPLEQRTVKIKSPSLGSVVWHGMHPGLDPLPLRLPLPESGRRPYRLDRQRRGERALG